MRRQCVVIVHGRVVYEVMEEDWRIKFVDTMDFDFAYEIEGLA